MYDLKIFSSFHRMPSNIIIVPLIYRNFLVLYNIIYFYFCLCFLFFWQHIQFLKSLLTPKSWSALPPSPPHFSPPSLSTHKYMLYIAQCALKFISVLLFQPPKCSGHGTPCSHYSDFYKKHDGLGTYTFSSIFACSLWQ